MKKLILLSLLPLLAGCALQGVPKNVISIITPAGSYNIAAPQNTSISNFVASVETNGLLSIKFGSWSSHNDPQVINSAGAADVARLQAISDLVQTMAAIAMQAAAAGAKGITVSDPSR